MSVTKRNFLSELEEIDWDFNGERANGGSGASHWYPARFVPQVPGILIGFLSEPADIILDPFCGSGTSLVEAIRLGRRGIGIDTNPVAVMITRSRTLEIEQAEFHQLTSELKDYVVMALAAGAKTPDIPNADENRLWYHPTTVHELALIWQATAAASDFNYLARAVFSGLLKQVCSQEKHWGWICDNVRPKSLHYKPVVDVFFNRLEGHVRELGRLRRRTLTPVSEPPLTLDVYRGDSRSVLAQLPPASVDAVVTSPPYFGMTDYVRSQRLSYLWFDWPFESDRALETGARYKRHRKNAYSEYMEEMAAAFSEISRVLKVGANCAIVAGESPDRQPYLEDFRATLEHECSFKVETVLHRTVARQRALSSRRQTEEIIIARRI
jgi:DNA modification methylase